MQYLFVITILLVQTTDLVNFYSFLFLNPSLAIFCEGAFHADMIIKISPLNTNFNWDTIDTAVSPPMLEEKILSTTTWDSIQGFFCFSYYS